MNEEEKNVIDLLKNIDKQKCLMLNCPVVKNNIERQLKIIELNRIIRKQSKEIESLKEDNKKKSIVIIEYQDLYEKLKDKIKAKIEELDEEIKIKREIAKTPMDRVSGRLLTDSIVELEETKKVLQSLLEKE